MTFVFMTFIIVSRSAFSEDNAAYHMSLLTDT